MTIAQRIQENLKSAMKQHDATTVSTLRLLSAALKNESIALRRELNDAETVKVIQREAKRRKEAMESYQAAGSAERVQQESAELDVLNQYLPAQLDPAAVEGAVRALIQESGASGPQDFGKVMKAAMEQLQGKADGRLVQETVRRLLENPAATN